MQGEFFGMGVRDQKQCGDCRMILSFEQFRQNHPTLSEAQLKSLWEDPLLTIYCPVCYFNRPEKPYKRRKRDSQWYRFAYSPKR
jgi:hypothetical protein